MPTSRETRITVDTSTSLPSVVLLNTSYLYRNRHGIIKSLIFVFSLISFILLLMYKHKYESRFFFLLLVTFCHLYVVTLMCACCLFSITTATLMTKISFDFIFHGMAFLLYLIGGLWIVIQDINDEQFVIKIIAVCTLIVSFLHLAHSVLSYKQHIS